MSYIRAIEATAAAAATPERLGAPPPPRVTASEGVRAGGAGGWGAGEEGREQASYQARQHQQQAEQHGFPASDPWPAGIGGAGQWDGQPVRQVLARSHSLSACPLPPPFGARVNWRLDRPEP
jgi:hypothetical protein